MSITPKNKSSKTVSERERFIGFVYVLTPVYCYHRSLWIYSFQVCRDTPHLLQ